MEIIVVYNRPAVMNCEGVRLLPGANVVHQSAWDHASKHPIVHMLVEEGTIEVLSTPPAPSEDQPGKSESAAPPPPPPAVQLTEMKTKDSMDLISRTVDLPLLESWYKMEKRKGVKSAIKSQIDAIKAPPVHRSDDPKASEE